MLCDDINDISAAVTHRANKSLHQWRDANQKSDTDRTLAQQLRFGGSSVQPARLSVILTQLLAKKVLGMYVPSRYI
ncbi:hypothetical protein TSUD_174770 [Trifolium subterraneum]|uniref:Uncharacterized protein n=1 Tax=Trifolium subterraneum TaxID=3900 RepID=A0A2Z6PFG8_TRISU|nr:hypothetical protein TSUD_174770 [Trifolium subterraneum]